MLTHRRCKINPPCIFLLGPFRVEPEQQFANKLRARKVQELLAYLLLNPCRVQRREELADMLWGDREAIQTRKYLRQALWRLHVAFDSAADSSSPLLLTTADTISLNPARSIWVDARQFENDYQLTIGVPDSDMNERYASVLQCCIDLYKGDLLEGWYTDWCAVERERLRNCYLGLLYKLLNYHEQYQRYELCLRLGETILHCDGAFELAHRELMRVRYLMGDRIGALRQYERCARRLWEEFCVQPSELTNMLHEQIQADCLSTHPVLTNKGVAEGFLGQLHQLEMMVASLSSQVEQIVLESPIYGKTGKQALSDGHEHAETEAEQT